VKQNRARPDVKNLSSRHSNTRKTCDKKKGTQPAISIVNPGARAKLTLGLNSRVRIEILFSDTSSLDTGSFTARLNHQDITGLFSVGETKASCAISTHLKSGKNILSVSIKDVEGHRSTAKRKFIITYLPPTVRLSAEPQTVKFGESTTLAWNVTNADKISIEPGIGEIGANDSVSITPYKSTTYTITAQGPGGTATDSLQVDVDISDMPPAGIYYKYDNLGRITQIMRIPETQDP
jgi:uncharacterized cupredoxin-like copper-binding protein